MKSSSVTISWESLIRIIVTGLGILFVWKAFSVLVMILVASMLATALYPIARLLSRKLPFILSCFLVILLLLVPILILIATVLPTFIHQFPAVLSTLNSAISQSSILPSSLKNIDLTQYAQNLGTYLLQSTSLVTSVVGTFFTLLFLTFYLLLDSQRLLNLALTFFNTSHKKRITQLLHELGRVTGMYLRGNLFIALICGTTTFIGLTLIDIPFAAPLAIFTALMNLLPLIGLLISMSFAIIIGLTISPVTALLVAILYIVYQQIETIFLAPTVYNKALNLSPALGFLSLIIGSSLFGIVGAFLALPIAASLPAIIKFLKTDLEEPKLVKSRAK